MYPYISLYTGLSFEIFRTAPLLECMIHSHRKNPGCSHASRVMEWNLNSHNSNKSHKRFNFQTWKHSDHLVWDHRIPQCLVYWNWTWTRHWNPCSILQILGMLMYASFVVNVRSGACWPTTWWLSLSHALTLRWSSVYFWHQCRTGYPRQLFGTAKVIIGINVYWQFLSACNFAEPVLNNIHMRHINHIHWISCHDAMANDFDRMWSRMDAPCR